MFHPTDLNELKGLTKNKRIDSLDILMPDMLGIVRGKKISGSDIEYFFESGMRAPRSIYLFDSIGHLCRNLPYGMTDGDPDFRIFGHMNTLRPGLDKNELQIFAYMDEPTGSVSEFDTRHILHNMIEKFKDFNLSIKIGIELEFYLLKKTENEQGFRGAFDTSNSNSIDELDRLDDFFNEINSMCNLQSINLQSMISETGAGQFEVTLSVSDDVLKACDNLIIVKRIIRKVARRYGFIACFMAKPFTGESGSGMHVHLSFYDKDNRNIIAGNKFTELSTPCSEEALHIIYGMLHLMDESIAIFGPNANSFRRFKVGSFAPINKAWGSNNRTVAVRLPIASKNSARLEHRLAGSDSNPYLVVAVILVATHFGLLSKKLPPHYTTASAYNNDMVEGVPGYWSLALKEFAKSKVLINYFGSKFHNTYLKHREFECSEFHAQVTNRDFKWYLGAN